MKDKVGDGSERPLTTTIPGSSSAGCRALISPTCSVPGAASANALGSKTCEFMTCAIPLRPERLPSARASR